MFRSGFDSMDHIYLLHRSRVFLSKKVLANLITWDGTIHNTIDNVSGAKLGFALLWVIRYPVLLFKLGDESIIN